MDTFFDLNESANRLFREYKKHKQLIIAVDFDDTVYDYHSQGTNHQMTLELLKECSDLGFHMVIWTASVPTRYEMMLEFFKMHKINIASINKNPIDLPFGNNGKMYYNILLDDRAGLYSAYLTLKATVKMIYDEK
jgi:hypothetical protein